MRSPLDTSTLVLAGGAAVLAVMLSFVIPRMVVALLLAGLMQVLVPLLATRLAWSRPE